MEEEKKILEPYQLRVIDEFKDIDFKVRKIEKFILTDVYKNLSKSEQSMIDLQVMYMTGYYKVLMERINRF